MKTIIMNNLSTQNQLEEPYWVVMGSADPRIPQLTHVLVVATSEVHAATIAYGRHGANGWSCIYGAKLRKIVDQINRVQNDSRFGRGQYRDWFLTVIEDRATNTREGVMIVAKNPRKALKLARSDIRSKGAAKGRFVVVVCFGSAYLAEPINRMLADLEAQANRRN